MDWYWSPAGLVMAPLALVLGGSAWCAWRRHPASAAGSLAMVLAASAWWCAAYALELSGASLDTVRFWGDLKYLGITAVAPAWLVFALQYTERAALITPRRLAALAVMPLATLALLANDTTHDLVRAYPDVLPPGTVPYVAPGPLFWVHLTYTYLVLLAGAVLLLGTLLTASHVYRRQGVAVAFCLALCATGNILHNVGAGPFRLVDVTPFAILVTGIVLVWGVQQGGLLALAPVARDAVIERMSDAVVVLDALRRVVDVNPAARRLLGGGEDEPVLGRPLRALLPECAPLLDRAGAVGDAHSEVRLGPDGQEVDLALSALRDASGRHSGHVLVLRDVSARKRDADQLTRLAHEDPLTGLANRKLLLDRLQATLRAACSSGRSFGLLFCDLDRFKRINDTLGHEVGDLVLQQVARRLTGTVGASDVVARLGGDEFVVLLPDVRGASDVLTVAHDLVRAVAEPVRAGAHELYLTVSVGACRYPEAGQDVATLLRNADTAMYRAKMAGRNRVESHRGDEEHPLDLLSLERDLHGRGAGELELWYQPITSLHTDTLLGFEALLRWRHPRRGLLEPDLFVPLAEQSGLVVDLGSWVLREACIQATAWRALHGTRFSVAVNVSARQFEPTLAGEVARVLDETGFDPSCLTLEITESAVLHDGPAALRILHELKDVGVRIATDDFGTGYTSLEQLRRYPLDVLKIDRSFVRGLHTRRQPDEVIVAAMVSLAHDLGLTVVAEGVETRDQRERLVSYSCDAAQGFLYSPPLEPIAAGFYLAEQLIRR